CYLEGMSRDEAAGRLGWSVSLVKNRLEQARDRLRRRLKQRGLSLSGTLLATLLLEKPVPAALPSPLAPSTVRAALARTAGERVAGTVPGRVAGLVEGALKATAGTSRGKWILLALASMVTGASLLAYRVPEQSPLQNADQPRREKP